MRSRRGTGDEVVRLSDLTRRAVIAAGASASAAPSGHLAVTSASAPTTEIELCRRWLVLDVKIKRLLDRWTKREAWLGLNHGWYGLTAAERQASPWAQELRHIDGRLETLYEERDVLLGSVPDVGSTHLGAVIAKLVLVERLIWPVDHPKAHALIAGSVQDLIALSLRGGSR